jgi:cathepsin A (carboxypeptidase C)
MITSTSPDPSGPATSVNTTYNPHSWTNHANVLFLDQPVGVGYSYSDSGSVDNSPAAAEDVHAFLQLFTARYGKYRDNDLHISGESYAGTYLPHIAHVIHSENKKKSTSLAPLPKLNFKSVMIGNGLSEPATQFASVPEYACDSPYAVYKDPNGPECEGLRSKMARCEKLAETCYRYVSNLPYFFCFFSSYVMTNSSCVG